MLASSGTEATIAYFLRLHRGRNPLIIPRNIMSDFDWAQLNALLREYWEAFLWLCWWHCLHAWQKHLHIATYPELWTLLKGWIRITDINEFNATWAKIQLIAPNEFVKYLKDFWMKDRVVRMWSAVYRKDRTIFENCDTNMLIEAWHHVLKGKFLHGKRNRRLDHLLSTLTMDVLPYFALKQRRQALGFEGVDIEVKKRQNIVERSQIYSKEDIVHVEGSKYLVPSTSDSSKVYEVDLDTYTCTCLDFPLICFCKHICAVQAHFEEEVPTSTLLDVPALAKLTPSLQLTVLTPHAAGFDPTSAINHTPTAKSLVLSLAQKMELLVARFRKTATITHPLDKLATAVDTMLLATNDNAVLPAAQRLAPVVKGPSARETMMPKVKTRSKQSSNNTDKAYGGGAASGSLAKSKKARTATASSPLLLPDLPSTASPGNHINVATTTSNQAQVYAGYSHYSLPQYAPQSVYYPPGPSTSGPPLPTPTGAQFVTYPVDGAGYYWPYGQTPRS
ncbi:hypothetical protein B0H16DRAFT_1359575 [Mycena metata]|uniref:SWIM-type domain-containing protein n=1 Tax=Mycena metata TaxID=1033252 RepID=A0AAD7NXZ2_9AGAR|nr:hypothetical protein B0H16DRAFT_1359575 [Mycena metata]